MTIREIAPTLFVGLFTLAALAMLGEIVVVVSTRVGRARGKEPPARGGALLSVHRVLRIVAPVCLLGAGAILAWLSLSPTDGASPSSAPDAPGPVASVAPVPIDPDGIGGATVGMTLGQLRSTLAPTADIGDPRDRFMVDVTALPVVAGPDTLYHLLFPVGTPVDENTPLELVATTHPLARTADGVGPGTTLEAAAERYGPPTLSYSVYDESREYARFPDQPSDRIRFRVAPAPGLSSMAGTYTTDAEYNETTVFDPEARIFMVLVRLRAPSTSGAAPPP
ncbi:MAG: hypothetical protein WEA34_03580 [Gemmatimonadota bacterium]